MEHSFPLFVELLFIVGPAALAALLMAKLRQPALVGYLVVGVVLGALGVHVRGEIPNFLAELGIVTLLFAAGLRINPRDLLRSGRRTLKVMLFQLAIFGPAGYGLGITMGLSPLGAIILAVCIWLSSTIIVVRTLERIGEIGEPHGRAMLSLMVVQDVVALTVIALLPVGGGQGEGLEMVLAMGTTLLKAVFIIALTTFTGRMIFPRIISVVENESEQLLILPLAWTFAHMGLAYALDFSMETAAFFAGLSLSTAGYSYIVSERIRPLTNVGLLFFFVQIGTRISLDMGILSWQLLAVVALVVIGTPIINYPAGVFSGLGKRAAFVTGFIPAQISEFSLVVVTLAVGAQIVDAKVLSLVTLATVITMVTSSLIGARAGNLYEKVKHLPILSWADKHEREIDPELAKKSWDGVIYGADEEFFPLVEELRRLGLSILIIDLDRDRLALARHRGYSVVKADYLDPDVVQTFIPKQVLLSTTLRSKEADLWTIELMRKQNPALLAITLHEGNHITGLLRDAGWNHVINPKVESARRIHNEIAKNAKRLVLG